MTGRARWLSGQSVWLQHERSAGVEAAQHCVRSFMLAASDVPARVASPLFSASVWAGPFTPSAARASSASNWSSAAHVSKSCSCFELLLLLLVLRRQGLNKQHMHCSSAGLKSMRT